MREWLLLAVIIVVPLVIAVAVTLWSLKQVQYKKKAVGTVRTSSGESRRAARPDVAVGQAGAPAEPGPDPNGSERDSGANG